MSIRPGSKVKRPVAAAIHLPVPTSGFAGSVKNPVLSVRRAPYRRDRRKDLLLQERGYLVVRFLTDDVSKRLSDVLDTLTHILMSRATRQ